MPQSALVWLREKVGGVSKLTPLDETSPLTELEGIDLYDRTRLAEEGINNVEALAHADIVDLMSSTRISAAELVDWTDQAILYLRVGGDAHAQMQLRDGRSEQLAAVAPDVRANMCHLRKYGIRTASDLLQVYEQAHRRGSGDGSSDAQVRLLRRALKLPSQPAGSAVPTIQTIIDTLPDEEWFMQVRNWRRAEFGAMDAWYTYLDGCAWNTVRLAAPKRVEVALRPFFEVPVIDTEAA
jgi:hypothetical protein